MHNDPPRYNGPLKGSYLRHKGRCVLCLLQLNLSRNKRKLSQMTKSESSYLDTDSLPEEKPILRLFNPTTGEELDLDSIQYQTLCRFLYSDNNHPGSTNQKDKDLHQGQHLPGKGLRRPVANHVPEDLYQRQHGNVPLDTQHQGQGNDSPAGFRGRTNPLFIEQPQQLPHGRRVDPLFSNQPGQSCQVPLQPGMNIQGGSRQLLQVSNPQIHDRLSNLAEMRKVLNSLGV